MSGGVDSSASAWLLKQQGHEEIGLFMRSGATEEAACATEAAAGLPIVSAAAHKQGCCSASDAADARRVADTLDIPFHALNFQDAFGRSAALPVVPSRSPILRHWLGSRARTSTTAYLETASGHS